MRDLTVTITGGGVIALLGPNGAGKSTLLKLCIGFETPSAGRMTVCGIDPVRDRRGAVASIGYVPQSPGLYRDTSVEDHLAIAGAIRPGFDTGHARERLQALGIRLRASPAQLSGGQQAQVCLAIALGTRAPLLLLDEPLASLDPLARREFLAIARDSARSGDVTIVLSSHVISEIDEVADRILVLGDGVVLYHDTVAASVAGHRVLDDGAVPQGADIVGRFPGRRDEQHVLVRSADTSTGRAGTLEEVVMGYLAAGREVTTTDWSGT
ncbi:MAG TPA: ABC transporter ATP-binding protein [Candidatus Limnocylindrales bacterium]